MFCPQCGNESREPYKFCKLCGANLNQVKRVMNPGPDESVKGSEVVDWKHAVYKDWKENLRKTPEEKRLNEIKGGVITTCVSIGATFFLYFLLTAVAAEQPGNDAAILHVVRWVGLIPLLIGLGILFNGLVISKRIVEVRKKKEQEAGAPLSFPAVDTSPIKRLAEPVMSDFSVTETTTTKLREPIPVQSESSSETD